MEYARFLFRGDKALIYWTPMTFLVMEKRFLSHQEFMRLQEEPGWIGGRLISNDKSPWLFSHEGLHYEIFTEGQAPAFNVGDLLALKVVKMHDHAAKLIQAERVFESSCFNPFPNAAFRFQEAQLWQKFMGCVRDFFISRDFLELRTPTLVPSPGLEPFLDPFSTEFQFGKRKEKLFLPTSPEFHLKKALVMGFARIFEFKECFRNGELSDLHQPEFLMLEWYRSFSGPDRLIEDIRELMDFLQRSFKIPAQPLSVITMPEFFHKHFYFDLQPGTEAQHLWLLCEQQGVQFSKDEDFDTIFSRIFIEKIEPRMGLQGPEILRFFPPSQAALATLTPDGWADRFELFWKGKELANAFNELNEPNQQRARFLEDQKKKKALGKEVVPLDDELLKALEFGMPPSAGIALGMERLFMLLTGKKSLSETRLFPMS